MSQSFGKQIKFYSDRLRGDKRTALDVQFVKSAGNDSFLTVNFTIAPFNEQNSSVIWDEKVIIQLSRYELTQCCAVLFGLVKELRANFHGEGKNKGLTIIHNGPSGCGINISDSGRVMTHMINHQQRIELGAFMLNRQSQAWDMSVSDVLAILRQSMVIQRG
ncbi:hypothetical protein OO184_19870 [Photorhabdus sp. APURE]|uniref:hypothetical protein n=1 Tax=Photorhabdus aballayi TaxID=2991723 RepID=UPI00223D95DC|nr:hypothetical protein [Photorhabdus aballayi]MCW7550127.1 hypothetical protein [Photorhabdus aballayi]